MAQPGPRPLAGRSRPHRADGDRGGTAQTLTPAFDRAVYSYTVYVANSLTQVTVSGTPDGDGTVTEEQQVDIPPEGYTAISVVVTHVDGAMTTMQTYTVQVIREGTVGSDRAALIALYNSTDGAKWTDKTNWGSNEPLGDWSRVTTNADGRVIELELDLNKLTGPLPHELGNLTSLTNLRISSNALTGKIPASLGDLTNLTDLRLTANVLTGEIPASLGDLTNLENLALRSNELTGEIPASLGDLTNLTNLELWRNELTGPIPASLGDLANLQELQLSGNALSGPIPASLGNLPSLERLVLFDNQLTGPIPASLGNLTSLETLSLDRNALSGTIPDLSRLPSLTTLNLRDNQLSGTIPASLGDLTSLYELYLSNNKLTGEIPASLGDLTSLLNLYLSGNKLTGEIPASLGNLTSLEYLDLHTNQLSGKIPPLNALTSLTHLDLHSNQLSGRLPGLLSNLTSLTYLYLSANLTYLDLSRNNFDGPIHELSALTKLTHLDLHSNQLNGKIPPLRALTNLTHLALNSNQLTGGIPFLGTLTNLTHLDLHANQLNGRAPDWLNNLTALLYLSLRENQLWDPIPDLSALTFLTTLNLGGNQLSGTIPDLTALASLTTLDLSNNRLSGAIPATLYTRTTLTHLALNHNQLTGPIPAELGLFTVLQKLTLNHNQLTGTIPAELGNLTQLKVTRFASNPSLTGCVPLGLRFLITAEDYEVPELDPNRRFLDIPAQDFLAEDANRDGDTDDMDDIPGLNLPFCMLSTLEFSDVTLVPAFAPGTATYTADVVNTVESTTITATLADSTDRLSIRKGTASYASGDSVPLGEGHNTITITVTPTDRILPLTYTVTIFRDESEDGGDDAEDRDTLMELYNSTGGASSWTNKTNWGSTEPLNDWYGVIMDANGRVNALELPSNNLSGTLPASLGSLTSLDALNLDGNQLTGTIPDLSALTRLSTLNLGGNQLTGTIPDLSAGTSLVTLNLSDNQLSGTIPAWLGSHTELQLLYLGGNQLTGTIPEAVGNLPAIYVTRFAGNTLTGCVPNKLRGLLDTGPYLDLPVQDFIPDDANEDGDTADVGDTPGLGLPFCTLRSLTLSDVTLDPAFASNVTDYTATVAQTAAATRVAVLWYRSGDTVSIMKGTDTYANDSFDLVPLDVGQNVITISVTTSDGTPSPHIYTVTVTRAPNPAPIFNEGSSTVRGVVEEAAAFSNIGGLVRATDALSNALIYSLDATSAASFSIDNRGQLRTRAALDYETKSSYTVTVLARDRNIAADEAAYGTITVTILVANVNEAPKFPTSITETGVRNVDENASPGVNIGEPVTATDADNDPLTYSLGGDNRALFDIDSTTGQLQTKVALNYESYGLAGVVIRVIATDTAGLTAALSVVIEVNNLDEAGTVTLSSTQPIVGRQLTVSLDEPDVTRGTEIWSWESSPNGASSWTRLRAAILRAYTPVAADVGNHLRATASYDDEEGPGKSAQAVFANSVLPAPTGTNTDPEFPSDATARNLDENTAPGVNIGEPVAATDPENGTLTYSLNTSSRRVFDIDSTGQLKTKGTLNYERSASYAVTVTAADPSGKTDTITVTITVNNLEEAGTVTLSSPQPLVGTSLTATLGDPDRVVDGSATWLWASSPNGASSWTPISGATTASYTPVTADVGNDLRATASYTDGEGSGKSEQGVSANRVLQPAPKGTNQRPQFPNTETVRHIVNENTVAGVNIGRPVAATDPENDTLTYSLGGTDRATFDIVATTGQLKTKAALDFESTNSYSVAVTAADPSGEEDTIDVTITVIDAEEAGTVTLSSTQPIVDTSLTATLEDPDVVSGGETWSWERSPDGASSWTPISGATSDTYMPVTADMGNYLRATASYTDVHGPDKSAQAVSANRVQPAPTLTNQRPEFAAIDPDLHNVDENTRAGGPIGPPVMATDADNDPLTYSLDNGDGGASFDIDSTTGQLRTKAALDYETTATYSVTVTATDTSGVDVTYSVTINVNNLDEPATITMSSQQPLVTIELTATLDEPDEVRGSVTWSWASSPDGASAWTTIREASRAIYRPVAGDLGDYLRATASYTDGHGAGKSALAISANAVGMVPGRNAPVLREYPTATRSFGSNTPAGSNVGAPFTATDPDNDALTYSLGGPDAASFDIVSTTGQLLTNTLLTGIRRTGYVVFVSISDGKDDRGDTEFPPQIDATTRVTITLDASSKATGRPAITGKAEVGEELTANTSGIMDADGLSTPSYAYQWVRVPSGGMETDITGATSAAYTVTQGDLGVALKVKTTFTDDKRNPESAESALTAVVTVTQVVVSFGPGPYGAAEGGPAATVQVSLDKDPHRTVTILLTATPDGGADSADYIVPIEVVFNAGETTKDVTVTAVDDSVEDDGESVALTFGMLPNGVSEGATTQVVVQITDNDGKGIVLSPTSLTVPEGGSATYTVALASQPTAPVTVTITGHSGTDVGLNRMTLSFTTSDWNTEQSVIASADQDNDSDNDSVTLTHTASAADYAGVEAALAVTVTDDDEKATGAPVISGPPEVGEMLAADTSGIMDADGLSTPSYAYQWVRVASGGQETDITGATSADYTVTQGDLGVALKVKTTFTDDKGNPESAESALTAVVTVAQVVVSFGATAYGAAEGGPAATVQVSLDKDPHRTVTIPLTATPGGGADSADYIAPTEVVFNAGETTKDVTVTAVDDSVEDDGESVALTFGMLPNGVSEGATTQVVVQITDNDGQGIVLSPTSLTVTEGGSATYTVALASQPTAPVTVTITGHSGTELTLTPATAMMTFTPSTWNTPQTVTVYAAQDIDTNNDSVTLTHTASGADYAGVTAAVQVTVDDDDSASPPTATPTATPSATPSATVGSSSGSSGGGGGGGRSRSRATPTPTPSPTPTATPTPTGPQFSGVIAAEPSVTATVVPEGTTLGLNGGADLPGGVYVNFPPTAVTLPVPVSVSLSNEAPDDVTAPSGTTLLPLTINITPETPLTLGEPLTIEINPTPEQLAAAGGDLNQLAVGVVTPNGIVVLPATVMHGRLVVTTDRIAPFVLLAVTDTSPVLTQPPMGDASSMGPLLQWTQPPGTTWFQVQVIPFNEDGPGINLVIGDSAQVRAAQYQVMAPNFGSADPNYVMLPGMTYLWRVRTATVLTNPTAADWSAWAVSSFKTPPASSSTITRVAPPYFGEVRTLTPTLTWANSNAAVFYYEVQISRDFEFGPNAFLYSEYVHGGASTPANSYVVPAAFPLEAGEIYYWRVRPRIQGDGDPLPWSATYVFLAPG